MSDIATKKSCKTLIIVVKYKISNKFTKEKGELLWKRKAKFGIIIIQTDYIDNKANTKTKEIKYITNDEIQEEKILNIFKENQVTPINSEEIIADLFRTIY